MAAIDLHNAEFKEGKHTFTITENRFADMVNTSFHHDSMEMYNVQFS